MLHLEYKTTSTGCSWESVLTEKRTHYLLHLVIYFEGGQGGFDFPVLLGQIAFVHCRKAQMFKLDQPLDERVFTQGFVNAVDLDAFVLQARVGKEQDFFDIPFVWSYVQKGAVPIGPDGMTFRLYQHTGPMPDSPAHLLFATMSTRMLWHDAETFQEWLADQGPARDIARLLTRTDGPAKRGHIFLMDERNPHGVIKG